MFKATVVGAVVSGSAETPPLKVKTELPELWSALVTINIIL